MTHYIGDMTCLEEGRNTSTNNKSQQLISLIGGILMVRQPALPDAPSPIRKDDGGTIVRQTRDGAKTATHEVRRFVGCCEGIEDVSGDRRYYCAAQSTRAF